ncbi:MAG: terminase [Bacteroidota bacterium]
MAGRNENKKELAYLLYMQSVTLKEICERVGIGSNKTLGNWIKDGGWKEKRAAKTISRTELINKTLGKINEMLDKDSDDFSADKLSKMAALIEKLDKQDSPVIIMGVLMEFGKWLHNQSTINKEVSLEFIKMLNKYQDLYITQKLNG